MMIIPVLDLLDEQVVHAIKGQRHLYQPVTSTLSATPDPYSILEGYLGLFPFPIVYIADLNAIQGKGNHSELINDILQRYAHVEFWIDAGHEQLFQQANASPVFGTENDIAYQQLVSLLQQQPGAILSLDYDAEGKLMNPDILNSSDCWPDRIIAMMLSRVGTGAGIDSHALEQVSAQAKDKQVFVGGGISCIEEVQALQADNVSGALVASALHNGSITPDDIQRLMKA